MKIHKNSKYYRTGLFVSSFVAGVFAVSACMPHHNFDPEVEPDLSHFKSAPNYVLTPEEVESLRTAEAADAEYRAFEDQMLEDSMSQPQETQETQKPPKPLKERPENAVISLLDPDYYPQ